MATLRRDVASHKALTAEAGKLRRKLDARNWFTDAPKPPPPTHAAELQAKVDDLRAQIRKLEDKKRETFSCTQRKFTRVPENIAGTYANISRGSELGLGGDARSERVEKSVAPHPTPYFGQKATNREMRVRLQEIFREISRVDNLFRVVEPSHSLFYHLSLISGLCRSRVTQAALCMLIFPPYFPFAVYNTFNAFRARRYWEEYGVILYPHVLHVRAELVDSLKELYRRKNIVFHWLDDDPPPEVSRAQETLVCWRDTVQRVLPPEVYKALNGEAPGLEPCQPTLTPPIGLAPHAVDSDDISVNLHRLPTSNAAATRADRQDGIVDGAVNPARRPDASREAAAQPPPYAERTLPPERSKSSGEQRLPALSRPVPSSSRKQAPSPGDRCGSLPSPDACASASPPSGERRIRVIFELLHGAAK